MKFCIFVCVERIFDKFLLDVKFSLGVREDESYSRLVFPDFVHLQPKET